MIFAAKWALSYALIMFAMSLDNVFWIPDSPEWKSIKKNFKVFTLNKREYGFPINLEGWSYVWNKRVLEVIKHPRDIAPALVSSLIMAVIV